jgi:3-dehydroquinate dehydratase II
MPSPFPKTSTSDADRGKGTYVEVGRRGISFANADRELHDVRDRDERPQPEPARHPQAGGVWVTTLADVERMCQQDAEKLGSGLVFLQSNHEGQLVDWIHETGAAVKAGRSIGAVYNPGAHTHYSYAIADAIEAATLPVIELHISNVHAREEFRHHSVISPLARGIIVGFGVQGYSMAINGLYELSQRRGSVLVTRRHLDSARPSNSALITLSAVSGIGAVRPPEKMIHPALRTSPRSPS